MEEIGLRIFSILVIVFYIWVLLKPPGYLELFCLLGYVLYGLYWVVVHYPTVVFSAIFSLCVVWAFKKLSEHFRLRSNTYRFRNIAETLRSAYVRGPWAKIQIVKNKIKKEAVMFGAFVGGFMSFMGMYAAYKVVKSGLISHVAESLKGKPQQVSEEPSERWRKPQ